MASTTTTTTMTTANNDYGLTTPVAPEGGLPVFPGNSGGGGTDDSYGLTTPVAPPNSPPVYSGPSNSGNSGSGNNSSDNDYGLTHPIAPEGGSPVYSGPSTNPWPSWPSFPTCPNCSGCPSCIVTPQQYGQVRFLNASTANTNVSVTIDNTTYATSVSFGTVSGYRRISDGFHTVSVRNTTGLRSLVVQQNLPFSAGQKYTLILTDTAAGGVDLIQTTDTGCSNLSANTGCYRVANMAYSGSSFDVMLYSHDTVFRNVGFQDVTAYKQAMAGTYQFYITNSASYSVIRELPILIIGAAINGSGYRDPLVSYSVDIAAGNRYTSYLIGSSWSDLNFRVLTVQD